VFDVRFFDSAALGGCGVSPDSVSSLVGPDPGFWGINFLSTVATMDLSIGLSTLYKNEIAARPLF
jgi:hypothetical protein